MPGGRPTSLTKETSRAIVEALKAGNYIDTACKIAGIRRQTFYNWLERGKAGESPFSEFFDICEKAIAESEKSMLADIRRAGKENWQAIAWIMERRFRDRWRKPSDGPASSNPGNQPTAPPTPKVEVDPPTSS